MSKFKVGDIVKGNNPVQYCTTSKNIAKAEVLKTENGTIVIKALEFAEDKTSHKFITKEEYFDIVERQKRNYIIIYKDNKRVVAIDKETGKTGVAKCHPDDEFDFNIGAKLAFERLMEPPKEEEKFYNGKVVCVDRGECDWVTTGKIYEFKDGIAMHDDGTRFCSGIKIKCADDLNHIGHYSAKFIEVVE